MVLEMTKFVITELPEPEVDEDCKARRHSPEIEAAKQRSKASPERDTGHTPMKTVSSTVLDPSRRSDDARDFEGALRRKIVGQDAAVEKVVEIYQMFLAGLNAPNVRWGICYFWARLGPVKPGWLKRWPKPFLGSARLHQDRLRGVPALP